MRRSRKLALIVGIMLTRGAFLPGCSSADDGESNADGPGRFALSPDAAPSGPVGDASDDGACTYSAADPDTDDGGADAGAAAVVPCSADMTGASDAGSEVLNAGSQQDTCDYPATCSNATSLGSECGDQGSATKTYSGYSSMWLGVRLSSCNGGFLGLGFDKPAMKMSAKLTVPSGENFDLYVYGDTSSGSSSCTKIVRKSTGAGSATETVDLEWSSGKSANFRFEVRHVSGTCSSKAKWKLVVAGNQL